MSIKTIVKAATLIILNTVAASIAARWIVNYVKGSQARIDSVDQPYFFAAAAITAFISTLILMRWILRFSVKESQVVRWAGVCLLNIGVVLITHIGAGTALALQSFGRYHDYMTSHSATYTYELWAGPVTGSIIYAGASILLFGLFTTLFGLSIAVFWLLLYRNWT